MALKDLWTLQDYIPESVKYVFKSIWLKGPLLINPFEVIKIFNDATSGKELEVSATSGDIEKMSTSSMTKLFKAYEKNGIPDWIATPTVVVMLVVVTLKSIMDTSQIVKEKTILQPLRKSIRPGLLDPGTLLQAELRNPKVSEVSDDELGKQGFSDAQIKIMRDMQVFYPGASDIVLFALREAYDDKVAAQFGTDDNLGTVLGASAAQRKAAGLTDDMFKLFWRSHWDLPGIQQAFDMFHRGLINEDALKTLLRVKDIMPFFQDKLLGISYNLLTRVDVRRMHKIGLFDEKELTSRYSKMGYSPDDAKIMTQFTVEYNKDPEESDKTASDKERELTKSDILQAFRDKFIDDSKASSYLSDIGYSDVAVKMIVQRELNSQNMKVLNALIKTYESMYIKGLSTKDETIEELQKVPVPTDQIKSMFILWDLEKASKVDLPSKTDILSWHKKGFIDDDRAAELLAMIGTQEEFIPFYLNRTSETETK